MSEKITFKKGDIVRVTRTFNPEVNGGGTLENYGVVESFQIVTSDCYGNPVSPPRLDLSIHEVGRTFNGETSPRRVYVSTRFSFDPPDYHVQYTVPYLTDTQPAISSKGEVIGEENFSRVTLGEVPSKLKRKTNSVLAKMS